MNRIEDEARSVFLAAMEREPREWSAFVNHACGNNGELLARVEQLLRTHQAMGDIHGGGTGAPEATANALPITEGPGTHIGPYKLVEQIGEGGMGIVFLAEQERPVRRRVAVKIIKPGMDTRQVIARFENERQAMALMEHANIAKVLDAGATESGRPYFVMELVHGVPITDYCDQCNLTTRERLELFVELCQAVQHAHQKGVIHRDIKPTNVLVVALEDGRPAPKIIDFGVAKAINQRLTEHTLMTSFAQMVGTPLYMSPEQAELSRLGVDTRSDVYSLGVLLYELLTGTTPFDKERLHTAPYDEVRRIIREEEPPRPSTRISTLAADLATTIASQRRTDPHRLLQTVRAELDWTVMKALEKDRNRRYESVNNFAADIQRFLNDEAVEACPPSRVYRLRKFVRRNRGPVATAVSLLLMLCLGLAGTSIGLLRARAAENKAQVEAGNAMESEHRATQEAANFRRLNFRMAFDRGMSLCEQGHIGRGMLWLARALELAPTDDASMRRVILANLNSWRRELHSLQAIFPHSEGVLNVAISPNGKQVLTASKDRRAQLWSTQTGKPIGKPMLHDGDVHEVLFSDDGTLILTANYDRTARLWETESNDQSYVFPHELNVPAADFTPDGRQIVTGSYDRSVRVWDAGSGIQVDELPRKHSSVVHDLRISTDGSRLLTACHDKNVRIWDFDTRELLATFKHDTRVPTADFTREDGSQIATGDSDGNVFLWDVAAAVTDDDQMLETSAKEFIRSWRHRGGIHRLRVSRDHSRILTGSFDNTAQLLDPETLAPVGASFEHEAAVPGVALSPDGSFIVTACEDNAARLWRPAVGQSVRSNQYECYGNHEAVYTSDGRYILSKIDEETVLVRETTTGNAIASYRHPGSVRAFAVSPDGSNVLTGNDSGAQLWGAATGEPLFAPFEHVGGVWTVAFSADGEQMITGGFGGTVQLRDVSSGTLIGDPLELGTRVWGTTFSPDGSKFAVACGDKVVRLCDSKFGNIPRPFARHQDEVVAVTFSIDGSLIATGSHDNTVTVWDAFSSKSVSEPMQHNGPIWYPTGVAFSPGGQFVVTGCDDWTVRIWDVETAKPIGPALVHEAGVRMVAFAGPSQVLTGTSLGTVRTWQPSIWPMEDDVQRITLWLQVVTGMELDAEGTLHILDAGNWQSRRQRLDGIEWNMKKSKPIDEIGLNTM